jgi:hypothetical protein
LAPRLRGRYSAPAIDATPEDASLLVTNPRAARTAADILPISWSPTGEAEVTFLAVRPIGSAWCVQGEHVESLVFRTGALAERAARRLARAMAQVGADARVSVYDARNVLVGTMSYFGVAEPASGA